MKVACSLHIYIHTTCKYFVRHLSEFIIVSSERTKKKKKVIKGNEIIKKKIMNENKQTKNIKLFYNFTIVSTRTSIINPHFACALYK